MRVVHLLASPFYGGPERQMLGLARHMPAEVESVYLSFAERGLAAPFIDEVRRQGYEGALLAHNAPHIPACVAEVAGRLRALRADLLCCSVYKPDLVGWIAARRIGIPVVAVSHGWTAATWKVRVNEALDRWVLRRMDAVACVSQGQAEKVRQARVPEAKIVVIPNAVGAEAFGDPDPACRAEMERWFTPPPRWLVGTAGRFSPEKGFPLLIDAAAEVVRRRQDVGFILFGDGPERAAIEALVAARGLQTHVVLAGFRDDVPRFLPDLDLAVMSSHTEGLPVFLLEAAAAGLPCVATAVGGIPEVIVEGETGHLVAAGDASGLARHLLGLVEDPARRRAMGEAARARVRSHFTFEAMGQRYYELFARLVRGRRTHTSAATTT